MTPMGKPEFMGLVEGKQNQETSTLDWENPGFL